MRPKIRVGVMATKAELETELIEAHRALAWSRATTRGLLKCLAEVAELFNPGYAVPNHIETARARDDLLRKIRAVLEADRINNEGK